ncbi:hypothetical protein OIU77_020070 [Salix suchowensis]|uniref:Uncharacterized protein n=1 Tax=Salix suchowensis TaxID=1278906 RepID=A0ABQ9CMC8_9ROSI|nr:hypothetical protein OIU77_020070 [Salix suchowensis]
MGMPSLLSRLVLIIFVAHFAASKAAATRPGFIYTRTGGRCTPQFWSSRRESWPRMVPQRAAVSKVFGPGVFERRAQPCSNSYARKGFPYSAWEVKTLLIQALVSKEAAATQAKQFSAANEACD